MITVSILVIIFFRLILKKLKLLCYTLFATIIITKGCFIVHSIIHLIDSIESFSNQNFKFSQFFQPLNILNKIPDSIFEHINNIDFIFHEF